MNPRHTGVVAKVLPDIGHAFLVRDGDDQSNHQHHIFAHREAIPRAGLRLKVGARVSFEDEQSRTGGVRPEAHWIRPAA
jgi:cold shock CspA family protein